MPFAMYKHQLEALRGVRSGSIVYGGVGSGKTLITLAFYFTLCGGVVNDDGTFDTTAFKPVIPLYIITPSHKRDKLDWEIEASRIGIYELKVDSWNNIEKYKNIKDSFFIFDEQKVGGHSTWAKTFIKIASNNQWVLDTATPGDNWDQYAAIFIAHGFFKNFTDFDRQHVVLEPFVKYRKVKLYTGVDKLLRYKRMITVEVPYKRDAEVRYDIFYTEYDKALYNSTLLNRWNFYENEPLPNASAMCYALRKVSGANRSKIKKLDILLKENKRIIVFYSFNYELEMIRLWAEECGVPIGYRNGNRHDDIPDTESWVYVAQYGSWSEGANCTTCNTIVFYSMPYSYKTLVQAAGRIDRVNTPYKTLNYFLLLSRSPIDASIFSCVKKKKKFNEQAYFEEIIDTQKLHMV